MTLIASSDDETRSILQADGTTVLWGDNEQLHVFETIDHAEGVRVTHTPSSVGVSTDGGETMSFDVTLDPFLTGSSYVYNAVYPNCDVVETDNDDPTSLKVITPSTQKATATSFDGDADLLIAKQVTKNQQPTSLQVGFKRMLVLGKMTLTNVASEANVKSVKFSSPNKKITGKSTMNLTTGEAVQYGYESVDYVEVTYEDNIPANNLTVFFTCFPFQIDAGETFTVEVTTKDNKVFTRTFTIPTDYSLAFALGENTVFSVNMANAVQGLESGNYLILAKKSSDNSYHALKSQKEEGKDRLLSEVYSGSLDSYAGLADLIWTVTKTGDSYTVKNGNKFLGYTGSSNESYWLEAGDNWTEENYLLDITAQGEGFYYVQLHSNKDRYLSRNTSGSFFAFYGNTTQLCQIFFVPATEDSRKDLDLTFATDPVSLTTSNYNTFVGQAVVAKDGETDVTSSVASKITYSWDQEGNSFGTLTSEDGSISLTGAEGSAVVTANFAGDEVYKAAKATYTVSVVNPTGWVLVETAADVVAGEYIITWDNTYYLPNNPLAAKNPAVGTGITVANAKLTNDISDDMIWAFSGNNTDGFVISAIMADNTFHYLCAVDVSDGIKIVNASEYNNDPKYDVWRVVVNDDHGMLLDGFGANRYLAVYNHATWRNYTLSYYDGTMRLYKRSDPRNLAPIAWGLTGDAAVSKNGNTYTWTTPNAQPTITITDPSVSALDKDLVYSSSTPTVAEINAATGEITFNGAGSTVITATYEGAAGDTYQITVISYTLVITDDTTYTISINQPTGDVSGFTLSASPNGNQKAGTEITLSCTGSVDGYVFDEWNVYKTGDANTKVTVANGQFTMPAYAVTVEATFRSSTVDYQTSGTLASWAFTQDSYPSNNTDFFATSGACSQSTFYLDGSGSTWNTSKEIYAFTSVTDVTITVKAVKALKEGKTLTLSMDTYFNKTSNAPMKGFSIAVAESEGSAGTTGLSVQSWSLSTSSATKSVTYTIQHDVAAGSTVVFTLTGTDHAGSGQGYINNVNAFYSAK